MRTRFVLPPTKILAARDEFGGQAGNSGTRFRAATVRERARPSRNRCPTDLLRLAALWGGRPRPRPDPLVGPMPDAGVLRGPGGPPQSTRSEGRGGADDGVFDG